jgi:dihydrofolate synthase/folylpolyglutamate synthase
MTYDEAIQFWFGRINFETRSAAPGDLKLERMRALLHLLGDPHERLRLVHIAGTKGKGSTAAMIGSVLNAAGYRVGLFTSPHLERVEERMSVDGVPITHEELSAIMARIAPAVRELERSPGPTATFFEISTALGLLHFVQRRVDAAILEVGLGGRFDSTNVVTPIVSVITSIGYDHMLQLGNTLERIAYQKAGIIKPGVPVVVGPMFGSAKKVIEAEANEVGAPMLLAGRASDGSSLHPSLARPANFELGLLGEHQRLNAACAVATLDVLRSAGFHLSETAVKAGLKNVRWPARVELISTEPTVILDTAHNVPSCEALVETLLGLSVAGRKRVVFAVSNDKQYPQMLAILAGYFDEFHLTQYGNNPRCVPPGKLAEYLPAGVKHHIHATATEAWHAAQNASRPADLVCVTGSVFLAGELQPLVRQGRG